MTETGITDLMSRTPEPLPWAEVQRLLAAAHEGLRRECKGHSVKTWVMAGDGFSGSRQWVPSPCSNHGCLGYTPNITLERVLDEIERLGITGIHFLQLHGAIHVTLTGRTKDGAIGAGPTHLEAAARALLAATATVPGPGQPRRPTPAP